MQHTPVLLDEVIKYLDPKSGQIIVDGTYGLGGHARAIAEKVGADGKVIGIEQDPKTLIVAEKLNADQRGSRSTRIIADINARIKLIKSNYADLPSILERLGAKKVDGILLDLGISSMQLDDPAYGLSWLHDAPLDMRLSEEGESALQIIKKLSEKELADILYNLADERRSRPIAKAIKEHLISIKTTTDLASLIEKTVGGRGKIHPATKTFMTLRMLVNRELENLNDFMKIAPSCLKEEGRVVIISFHSGEDRIVKHALKNKEVWRVLTKKPIIASREEISNNSRSRSAKLRAALKITKSKIQETKIKQNSNGR